MPLRLQDSTSQTSGTCRIVRNSIYFHSILLPQTDSITLKSKSIVKKKLSRKNRIVSYSSCSPLLRTYHTKPSQGKKPKFYLKRKNF